MRGRKRISRQGINLYPVDEEFCENLPQTVLSCTVYIDLVFASIIDLKDYEH